MRSLAYTTFLLIFGVGLGQEEWLFLGPGDEGDGSSQSVVISLPLGSGTCGLTIDPVPEILGTQGGASAALLEGLVTLCNADEEAEETHCFSLDPVLGTWVELIEPIPYRVSGAQAISLPNGDMMILGGMDLYVSLDRTAIYSIETKTWMEGPTLPTPREAFCAVQLNTTHTLVTGGANEQRYLEESFIFDGASFHPIPSPQHLRSNPGCTLLASGGRVMVAGGYGNNPDGGWRLDSVEIYDMASNSWSMGPSLPIANSPAALVSRLDQVLFFSGYTTEIYSLGEDWEDGWMLEEVEMNEAHGYNPSLVLKDPNMLNC